MKFQINPLICHHLCLLRNHGDLVMDDTHRSAFARFLFVYKVLFSSLLLASIGMTIQLAFTSQYVEAGRTLRSALVFGVCLWVGFNLRRPRARFKTK